VFSWVSTSVGRLRLDRDGKEVRDPADVRATLTGIIDQPLNALAQQALIG
jgi:hypothetical protein